MTREPARPRAAAAGVSLAVTLLLSLLVCGPAPASAQARRHALLIGISDYEHLRDLEGPRNDVRSLDRVLRQDWGFDRISTLVDRDATRDAILGAISALIEDTREGDHVFLYFSGHGTSFLDQDGESGVTARLYPGTGGLYPVDLDPRAADAFARLLVGSRDLLPLLKQLDRGRDVFVVFDACFSGNTFRKISFGLGRPKFSPWPSAAPPAFGAGPVVGSEPSYPYDNLVYLAASAENETATDIEKDDLESTPTLTLDGLPHGALTDAMLRGLEGEADTDGDDELTVRELGRYVARFLEGRFPQTPQLLHPPGKVDAVDGPVFGGAERAAAPSRPARPVSTALRLRIGVGAEALRSRLAAVGGVSFVTGQFDLKVESVRESAAPGLFAVWHGSGDLLASRLSADDAVRRVAAWQASVHPLLSESFPGQDFNVRMDVVECDGPGECRPRTNAELFTGVVYEMRYEADVEACFLLVTVDVRGTMKVLVPWTDGDLRASRQGRIPDLVVSPPTGTEFVKLFGFRGCPAGLAAWMPTRTAAGRLAERVIESERDLDTLLQFVRASSDAAAETMRKFPTSER